MTIIDIVAGKSIGPLQLGPLPATVRAQVKLTGSVGELDGLKFRLAGEQVDDVWIEDLRTFAGEVRFAGETLARDIPLEQLKPNSATASARM